MKLEKNYRVVLVSRPGVNGEPQDENFGIEECPYPFDDLQQEEVLVKTLYLSVDPALRCRMNAETGAEYLTPWQIGETIEGLGGVGVVLESKSPSFQEGDYVAAYLAWPWIKYFTHPALQLRKLPKELVQVNPSVALSALGVTGITAYLGVKEKGRVTPGANQTGVVSAAAGSTGSLAGQIMKLEGCSRVVGICGSEEKCRCLTEELGFDDAINYKTQNITERLTETCPHGIDVYFDNVGGETSSLVIKQMNENSHVILCGQIAVYNTDLPYPPPIPPEIQQLLTDKNITRDRFLVLNYSEKFEVATQTLSNLLQQGKLKVKETVAEGLENTGKAFVSMMKGGNTGKQIVHVASTSRL